MIDCHCHLDRLDYEGAVKRAIDAGVRAIITNGLNYETNQKSLSLAKKYPIVKAALGSYPGEVLDEKALSLFEEDFIAIGEIGLDYSFDAKGQKEVFQQMLDLAVRLDKPVIVHSRKAEEDCIAMLEKAGIRKVVMHCFSGKLKLAKRIVKNGWYLSIPTNIVRSMQFQRVVEEVPLSSILTETDAPYLSPFPEYPNEPAFIKESIGMISKLKGMDPKEVENLIFMNYQRVFLY
ncbi:MAG: TatD family hydrolase [Candidatus Woesearchaeota archaeon]